MMLFATKKRIREEVERVMADGLKKSQFATAQKLYEEAFKKKLKDLDGDIPYGIKRHMDETITEELDKLMREDEDIKAIMKAGFLKVIDKMFGEQEKENEK